VQALQPNAYLLFAQIAVTTLHSSGWWAGGGGRADDRRQQSDRRAVQTDPPSRRHPVPVMMHLQGPLLEPVRMPQEPQVQQQNPCPMPLPTTNIQTLTAAHSTSAASARVSSGSAGAPSAGSADGSSAGWTRTCKGKLPLGPVSLAGRSERLGGVRRELVADLFPSRYRRHWGRWWFRILLGAA